MCNGDGTLEAVSEALGGVNRDGERQCRDLSAIYSFVEKFRANDRLDIT